MNEQRIKLLTVTDLHQDISLIDQLSAAAKQHKPDVLAFVGDFLNGTDSVYNQYTVEECAEKWSSLPARELLFIKGNHDHEKIEDLKRCWRGPRLNIVERDVFTYGPLNILCFPCIMGDFTDDVLVNGNPELWFPAVVRKYGPASRALWLMHEPPLGTRLSRPEGVLAGNAKWMEMVEMFQPRLVVFGHDHDTPLRNKLWNVRLPIGTLCVGLGQDSKLRYAILDFLFSDSTLQSIDVTAYPPGARLRAFPPAC